MPKSKMTTFVLCLLLGYLGAHRFYTGRIGSGVAQLLTGGGLGVWALWDLIQIWRNKYVDGQGRMLAA